MALPTNVESLLKRRNRIEKKQHAMRRQYCAKRIDAKLRMQASARLRLMAVLKETDCALYSLTQVAAHLFFWECVHEAKNLQTQPRTPVAASRDRAPCSLLPWWVHLLGAPVQEEVAQLVSVKLAGESDR